MNVLFTRLQNIGDMLVCVPALRALRRALPHAHITLLAKHAGGVEIIKGCPYVDELVIIRNRSMREKMRLLRVLRRKRFEYAIISPQDVGRVPLLWLGGARHIAGFPRVYNYGRWQHEKLPWLLALAPHHDTLRTETENCVRLVVDVLEACGTAPDTVPALELEYSWATPEDGAAADKLLRQCGISTDMPFVALAPYSKRAAKNWPQERWIELMKRMRAAWDVPLVLMGGAPEAALLAPLRDAVGHGVEVLAGATTLAQCAEITRRARLFAGPDSGPAFLATAVGTPAVVLYGPADYYRWRVPASAAPRREIFHPVACTPCRHQVCRQATPCMNLISVDEVWEACQQVWRSHAR